jgi:cell division protein FtsL
MASKLSRRGSKENPLITHLKSILFSTKGFPLVLTFTMLAIFFVVFRMRSIELEYQLSEVNRDIDRVTLENKELKAQKARYLSVNRLHELAKRYGMKQPGQSQVIIIP